jgi:hypothetical protein
LRDLEGDVDLENQRAKDLLEQHRINGGIDVGDEGDDNVEGWIDEMTLLLPAERERVEEDIRPMKLVLVKVRYQRH